MIPPLWKMVQRFPKKLGIKPPYDPAIPPLRIYPEETRVEKYTCITLFIVALLQYLEHRSNLDVHRQMNG